MANKLGEFALVETMSERIPFLLAKSLKFIIMPKTPIEPVKVLGEE